MTNLPIEILRTFIEVVDSGSMLRASERVHLTPSAVSLQIKRLEEMINVPLFYRGRRQLSLAPGGEMLVRYARDILTMNDEAVDLLSGDRARGPLRVGLVEDFARTLLAGALRRFATLNPDAQLQFKVGGSRELKELVTSNRLDIALYITVASDERTIAVRSVRWFGDESLASRTPLPLALLETPCLFRSQALAALNDGGVNYEIVTETASVSALLASIEAGIGVTPRTNAFLSLQRPMPVLSSLPQLPSVGYAIEESLKASKTVKALRNILIRSLSDL